MSGDYTCCVPFFVAHARIVGPLARFFSGTLCVLFRFGCMDLKDAWSAVNGPVLLSIALSFALGEVRSARHMRARTCTHARARTRTRTHTHAHAHLHVRIRVCARATRARARPR
eukprot:6198017-Pleurochrysis_carterae.AAC.3